MVFVCIALALFNFKANCSPSRQADNPCRDQPNGSFLNHPLGCKYFIVCNNGEVNMGSCPDGLAFNPLRPPCDLEANVDCSQFSTQSPTTTTQSTTTAPTPVTRPTTILSTTTTQLPTTTTRPTTIRSTTMTTQLPTTTTQSTTAATTQSTTSQTTTVTPTSTTTDMPVSTTTTTRRPTSTTMSTLHPLPSTTVRPVTPPMPGNPEQLICPDDDDPERIIFLASNTHCNK